MLFSTWNVLMTRPARAHKKVVPDGVILMLFSTVLELHCWACQVVPDGYSGKILVSNVQKPNAMRKTIDCDESFVIGF